METEETEFVSEAMTQLIEAFEGTPTDPDSDGNERFVSVSPSWWSGERTFGGMVVAQALHAAMRTVPPAPSGPAVHSLHAYFLRPSIPGVPSTHTVKRVRDGRSFALREVKSDVDGKAVFTMNCSFHATEEGDEYQLPMPSGLPSPEDVLAIEDPFDFDFPEPFEARELGSTEQRGDGTYRSTRRCWMRASERLPDDPALHACALAYMSDMTGSSFRPLSMGTWGTHTDASLDHALWFHRPARADEWNLYDLQALVNAGGRATVRATMYGEDGRLHTSMAQELLIRKLDVPIVFDLPPWVEERRRQIAERLDGAGPPVQEGAPDGTAGR